MTKLISTLCGLCVAYAFQTILSAQTITSQPQSITVNNASTATFTVGASNGTTYQWQFQGANIDGATNSALTLEDVMTNQAGSYTVVVNNSVTSSPPAVLTIVPGTIVRVIFTNVLGGGTNFVDVQLFDHDKPATVQNFLHYIRAGAYTNMFFDRCAPQFVLQGGDDGATDRTNTSSQVTGWDIRSRFVRATNQPSPPFPPKVASEFSVGPLIHNRFGTVAMALASGDQNSATSAFFFSLTDNSANLDVQNNGFTVFGRILNGTNVLQYFYGLTQGLGIVANSTFLDQGVLNASQPFPTLPVNYTGSNNAANANLVFGDFQVPPDAPVDTTPPTILITNLVAALPLTNALQGTASDNVGLAVVTYMLTPQAAADGTFPYSYSTNTPVTNYATGTANWSVNLYPGVYSNVIVQAQDGAGNLSVAITNQLVTNTAIVVSGIGTVTFTNGVNSNIPPVGYPFQYGSNYQVVAIPGTNQTFVSWISGSYTTTDPAISFPYQGNVFTATFISNVIGGIAFTSPATNAMLSNTLFNITGTIDPGILSPPVTVTCQIFTNAVSNYAVTFPQTTTGTTSWSVAVTNYLATGSYTIEVLATDHNGNQSLITNNFSFTADTTPPSIAITSPVSGAILYEGDPILIAGTASDSIVPLAFVNCQMIPLAEPDGVSPDYGYSFGTNAFGTTNWSVDLAAAFGQLIYFPGRYNLTAKAQDTAGNVAQQTQPLAISAITTNGNGTVTVMQNGVVKTNPIGYPLQYGLTYQVKATPGAGQTFLNWNYYNEIIPNAAWNNFTYYGGLLTATFIPSNVPTGTKVSFTYPPENARLMTNSLTLRGKIVSRTPPAQAQITCQIFSQTTGVEVGGSLTTSGTNTWSIAVSNLPPDGYVVEAVATNAAGLSTIIFREFSILDFKGVAGTYSGLFLCTNGAVAPTNSGLFTFTVAASGAFTGRLLFPAYRAISINSGFDATGNAGQYSVNLPGNPIYMDFTLDLTNGTDALTGSIFSQTANGWGSQLVCHRAVTKLSATTTPAKGKYILNLDPTNWPNTNGYASLSAASGGALAVSGALPDGASFSQSARVSKDGVWPLYAVPTGYKTNGMLMGWQTNLASGSSSGQLYWHKAPHVGAFYTGGVDTNVNSTGTNYLAPATGAYTIVFQGEPFSAPVTNQLTMVHPGGQFTTENSTNKLAISLSAGGVLTGHFVYAGGVKPLQFKGAFFGQAEGGSGFVLDSNGQTGYFLLEAQ